MSEVPFLAAFQRNNVHVHLRRIQSAVYMKRTMEIKCSAWVAIVYYKSQVAIAELENGLKSPNNQSPVAVEL